MTPNMSVAAATGDSRDLFEDEMTHEAALTSAHATGAPFTVSGSTERALNIALEQLIDQDEEPVEWYMRCLHRLFILLDLAGHYSPNRDYDFLESLSPGQEHATALLEEWWTKTDVLTSKVKKCVFGLVLASQTPETYRVEFERLEALTPRVDIPLLHEAHQELQSCWHDRPYISGLRDCWRAFIDCSTYHRRMFALFYGELSPEDDVDSSTWDLMRTDGRRDAGGEAAIERIGRAWLRQFSESPNRETSSAVGFHWDKRRLQVRDCHIGIPVNLIPCPWLHKKDGKDQHQSALPYYLWDIKARRTVETAELDASAVRYDIVSHTWGRWRKPGAGARVSGVPWLVPENTVFDVNALGTLLEKAGFHEEYVWLDLLCIPQERSDIEQVRICQVELARQAQIFDRAQTAVAWLHDVSDWRGAEAAIAWLGLDYLRTNTPSDMGERKDMMGSIMNELEAISTDHHSFPVRGGSTSWLSSLWTLQESMIRQDMFLASRSWEPLLAGDNLLITLDYLSALVRLSQISPNCPAGVKEFWALLMTERLDSLYQPSRLTPLILGQRRACTHSRAVAIMAVTGATDWFLGKTVEQFRQDEEVPDVYPIEFLREVCEKSGAAFFMSYLHPSTANDDRNARGSMLPFAADLHDSHNLKIASQLDCVVEDHETVREWVIQEDFSVLLPRVCIVASKTEVLETARVCVVVNEVQITLQEYVALFAGETYAVCTQVPKAFLSGIRGIILSRPDGQHMFRKLAAFASTRVVGEHKYWESKLPEARWVNWLVS